MTSRLVRAAMRLMPARRRDWAEALWAETGQAPNGRARLAWRAGGARLIAAGRLPRLLRFGGYALVPALTVAKASVEQVRDNPAAVPHVPQDASVPALTARTGWMLHWLYPGQPLTPARAYHYALMASLGTDGYVVILAFVPGLGLLLGMPAASAASPPGGLQLAGADADGP